MIDNDFPFSIHVIRPEWVHSVLLFLWKHSSEQQAFASLNAIRCLELRYVKTAPPNVGIYKFSCFPLFILILGQILQILLKSRGRNTITLVVQHDCSWLCRRQHRRSTILLCIAHYFCWREWWRVIADMPADQPMPPLWPLHFCLQFWLRCTLFLSGRTEASWRLHDFML